MQKYFCFKFDAMLKINFEEEHETPSKYQFSDDCCCVERCNEMEELKIVGFSFEYLSLVCLETPLSLVLRAHRGSRGKNWQNPEKTQIVMPLKILQYSLCSKFPLGIRCSR